jgi:hypothetical protein
MELSSQTDNVYKLKIDTYNEPVLRLNSDYPFSVTFSWKEKQIKVQLDNGEDVLKLAEIFSNMLTNNNIPNTITEINQNK